METVTVATPGKSYKINIGSGILNDTGQLVSEVIEPCKAAIITDDIVDNLYSSILIDSLESAGFSAIKYILPNGESSKTPENLLKIINFLAENHMTGKDAVFALGGGVVGDITGLAASVYLRGIRFIQLPTTLLAAVDSSVGGKTAVNLVSGKNLMGAYYQPDMVICDYSVFKTLPDEIFTDGCAEVIKYGMVFDRDFLELLKMPVNDNIAAIIKRCVTIKSEIVGRDERDKGERQLLNFGHTFGHAIEKCSNYSTSHGKAVAIGMAIITRASAIKGICSQETSDTLLNLLNQFGLPDNTEFSVDELYEALLSDKKRKGDLITLVIPRAAGNCILEKMPIIDTKDFLNKGL